MTVVSKYLDNAIVRYERLGFSKQSLSTGIVSVAIAAYVAHISYPHISKLIQASKTSASSSETSTSTSDDDEYDDDDDDFDDECEEMDGANTKVEAGISSRNDNNNILSILTKQNDALLKERRDNDETSGNCANGTVVRRKKNQTKVIKHQIKQAEKLLANQERDRKEASGNEATSDMKSQQRSIGLNVEFLFQLKRLIEIMIPKFWCREIAILGVHTVCLVSRTFLSIYVAAIEGAIVKFIVQKDIRQFVIGLLKWFGIAIPATFINSMIRYLENKLALALR